MKKETLKPSIEKFRVAQLSRPEFIVGGDGDGDDNGTDNGDPKEKKCVLFSTKYVDPTFKPGD
ncbi:hypothetical protein QYR09_02100 [Cellulophaga lytica]|nr:hypothetical protein QYR09_02100 [Cellulophaga lytica]